MDTNDTVDTMDTTSTQTTQTPISMYTEYRYHRQANTPHTKSKRDTIPFKKDNNWYFLRMTLAAGVSSIALRTSSDKKSTMIEFEGEYF